MENNKPLITRFDLGKEVVKVPLGHTKRDLITCADPNIKNISDEEAIASIQRAMDKYYYRVHGRPRPTNDLPSNETQE